MKTKTGKPPTGLFVDRHMIDQEARLGFGPIDHILIQVLRGMEHGSEIEFRAGLRATSNAQGPLELVKAEPAVG